MKKQEKSVRKIIRQIHDFNLLYELNKVDFPIMTILAKYILVKA